jgi:flagellar protein FlgJ
MEAKQLFKSLTRPAENPDVKKSSQIDGAKEQTKLKATCQDFESVFLNMMLSKMREAVPKDDLMGESRGEDVFRGMLDEELSKNMAAGGGVGLARMLYEQLSTRK